MPTGTSNTAKGLIFKYLFPYTFHVNFISNFAAPILFRLSYISYVNIKCLI
jgi:hypothetical protein